MFGIGTGELLLLALIALLVLGPERMPKLARDVGKTVADLRKTSDELRAEFMNADKALRDPERALDVVARQAETVAPAPLTEPAPLPGGAQESSPPDAGATQAEAATGPDVAEPSAAPTEPAETEFDREARLARERLEDPEQMKEHMERAKAEGWTVPADEAGTSPREG